MVFERPTTWPTNDLGLSFIRSKEYNFDSRWISDHSNSRLEEIVQWQRDTLYPKHHLLHGIQLIGSFHSLEPNNTPSIIEELSSYGPTTDLRQIWYRNLDARLHFFSEKSEFRDAPSVLARAG